MCSRAPSSTYNLTNSVCIRSLPFDFNSYYAKKNYLNRGTTCIQKGPLTPYSQATLELCKIVAAHVHWDTITLAISPVLTFRPAVLNHSDVCWDPTYRLSNHTRNEVKTAKKAPKPIITEYPTPWPSIDLPSKKLLCLIHCPPCVT